MAKDLFAIINCVDLPRARMFYERVFQAIEVYRFPDDGEPVYITVGIGGGQLALGVGTTPALYGRTPRPATGNAVDLCIYVDDLDATIDRARAAGSPVPVEPSDMPWGERVAYVCDPEGTMILVIQDEPVS